MPDARTAHLRLLAATVTSRCITSTAPTAPTDSAPPPPRTPSTRTRLDERESRERVQCLAMGAAGAANLSRRQLHQGRARLFHRHGTDHGAAFVAGDVGLVPTHLHNEAATAIRPDRLVRDNQEPSLSRATVGIISRRGARRSRVAVAGRHISGAGTFGDAHAKRHRLDCLRQRDAYGISTIISWASWFPSCQCPDWCCP